MSQYQAQVRLCLPFPRCSSCPDLMNLLWAAVRIYRPLSQVSSEEVRFYASAVKGWPVSAPAELRSTSRAADIDGLLDAFIGNLEAGFPATVSVISKTAAKMAMRSQEATSSQRLCPLCGK